MIDRIAAAIALSAILCACTQDVGPPAPAPDAPPPYAVDPSRVDAAPGAAEPLLMRGGGDAAYVTDAAGSALYYLEGNADAGKCDAACQQVWPPVLSDTPRPVVAPDLQQPAVGTLQLQGGQHHVTYHGHPLYRYAGDVGATTTTGDEVDDQWGRWRLMGADGEDAGGRAPAPEGASS